MMTTFRRRRSVSPAIRRLLELSIHYQQNEQDRQNSLPTSSASSSINQQAEKKIKTLVKALTKSKRSNAVEELEKSILHRDSRTKCIIVSKSFDPSPPNCVVDYCRLWRWPDLSHSNELKPIDLCSHAFHNHLDEICVNPFHYERVLTTYSVCVPRLPPDTEFPRVDHRAMTAANQTAAQPPQNTTYPISVDHSSENHSSEETNENSSTIPMETDFNPVTTVSNLPEGTLAGERIVFEEPREWCRLYYYEMSTRVGEQFRATKDFVIIDGHTNPSNDERFCLGSLTNVRRTEEIERTRRSIGHGVKLYHIRGNVFAECLSQNSVFVQSPIASRRHSWHPATVCKIPPTVRFQIFDSNDFTEVLDAAIREGYKAVHNLTQMCIIRMSLVKGWGVDYGRSSVSLTPCWIEICLDGPLKWIDNVLLTMRGPTESINSASD